MPTITSSGRHHQIVTGLGLLRPVSESRSEPWLWWCEKPPQARPESQKEGSRANERHRTATAWQLALADGADITGEDELWAMSDSDALT
ncbi:hypothetical protein G7Z17_g5475 [Cylindrodendrum hubeiense]|uniref:Uncharacterized protein n=1 Tax=Cylindrodendrum hubeiense TaxID=595255 RepID=A0A9P5HBZ5_9HYPO|nr:hypothetical protein G7Z17_g5475 [Cylindrodendrum hubeiense]